MVDHASNHVPMDIDLHIDDSLLHNHIAVDIGVKKTAERIVERFDMAAIMAKQSRLVIDLHRAEDDMAGIPLVSDGHDIAGNRISESQKQERIARFHKPYHDKIEEILEEYRPSLIMTLHSFTPSLMSAPNERRPWEVGVLYGEHETTSKRAIELLKEEGLKVGDQLPYSGKILNYTMDRHAEPRKIPYFCVEMRQDLVGHDEGCDRFAQILGNICEKITKSLA